MFFENVSQEKKAPSENTRNKIGFPIFPEKNYYKDFCARIFSVGTSLQLFFPGDHREPSLLHLFSQEAFFLPINSRKIWFP
jgi:hypothetical protein